jgi:SAM-dependent methyltransferase/methyltransferase-like protein
MSLLWPVRTMQQDQHGDLARLAAARGGDFDQLPYPSMPFAYTQPAHLAALATLYGLQPPAADSARVLELGCASGGNIIPLAARFPKARFVGLDLSAQHVRDGSRRIAALGLKNIDLRHGDLAEIEFAPNAFDYVICHGVFSWVPQAVQESILRTCRTALTAEGLAVISYNVLPGWHMRNSVREICLYHVQPDAPARERVAQARRILAQIAEQTSETTPYGVFLRNEVKRLKQLPAAYILGEFLSPDNTPMPFHAFVARAQQHRLRFLCEADLGSSAGEMLYPAAAERLKAQAGGDRLAEEQYKDFVSGRPFRRSVLTKIENGEGRVQVDALPDPNRLSGLYVASRLTPDASARQGYFRFRDAEGRAIETEDAVVRQALARLAAAYPSPVLVEELIPSSAHAALPQAVIRERVCRALFALVMTQQATVSTLAAPTGRADDPQPKIWPLARLEAAARQPWLTSLTHEPIPASSVSADLIAHLDGSLDRPALQALLVDWLRQGELAQSAAPNTGNNGVEAAVRDYLARALGHLAQSALLAP